MIVTIGKGIQAVFIASSQYRSPAQLAWGTAIGLSLGLIPKDNLLAILLVIGMLLLRINHLLAATIAIVFSLLGRWVDLLTHPLGLALLSFPLVRSGVSWIVNMPVLAWTRLNNTSVMGGFAVGMTATVPVFATARWMIVQAQAKLAEMAIQRIAHNAIEYRKSIQDKPPFELQTMELAMVVHEAVETAGSSDSSGDDLLRSWEPIKVEPNPTWTVSMTESLEATVTVEIANESIMQGNAADESTGPIQVTQLPTLQSIIEDNLMVDETILRETIIEVVRYKQPTMVIVPPMGDGPMTTDKRSYTLYVDQQGSSMNASQSSEIMTTVEQVNVGAMGNSKEFGSVAAATADPTKNDKIVRTHGAGGEESLRYLLWHINGSNASKRSTEKSV